MMLDFAAKLKGEKENIYTYDYEIALHNLLMKSIEN